MTGHDALLPRDLVSGERTFSFRINSNATEEIVKGLEILEENANLGKVALKAAKMALPAKKRNRLNRVSEP